MDGTRFDSLTRLLGRAPSRRATLALLCGLLVAPGTGGLPVAAKKEKKKKTTLCLNGQTIQASKNVPGYLAHLRDGSSPAVRYSRSHPECMRLRASRQRVDRGREKPR